MGLSRAAELVMDIHELGGKMAYRRGRRDFDRLKSLCKPLSCYISYNDYIKKLVLSLHSSIIHMDG